MRLADRLGSRSTMTRNPAYVDVDIAFPVRVIGPPRRFALCSKHRGGLSLVIVRRVVGQMATHTARTVMLRAPASSRYRQFAVR